MNDRSFPILFAQSVEDRKAVERAVLDYVEGFDLVQTERIECSVSKKRAKVGTAKSAEGYREVPRTFVKLYEGSKR